MLKKVAILGQNVGHSLSPVMYNAAFEASNLQFECVSIDLHEDEFCEFMDKVQHKSLNTAAYDGLVGFSVTMPYKAAVIPYLEVDEIVSKTQSVSCAYLKDETWFGTNLDCYGIETSLVESEFVKENGIGSVLVGGAGGAARSAVYSVQRLGGSATILCRNIDKAKKSMEIFENLQFLTFDDVQKLSPFPKIFINCTPLGLLPGEEPLSLDLLPNVRLVVDAIYRKEKIFFQESALQAGCEVIDGRPWLLNQGIKAYEIWTGEKAPIDIMRKAIAI